MPATFYVGVKVLIRNLEGHYLLIHGPDRGWEIPGGGVEEDEDLLAALHREVDEEVGIRIGNEKLAAVYTNHIEPPRILFWFLADFVSGDPRLSDEVSDFIWCPREQILGKIDLPVFRARIEDLLSFNGTILYRAFRASTLKKDSKYEILREARV